MREDKIISALIGLVRACDNNPKTANTDSVVIKALAFPVLSEKLEKESISEMINEIYSEKKVVAPNCANCASPCGNTSDYNMNQIYRAETEIRDIKLELISKCESMAAYRYSNKEAKEGLEADCGFLYKALSYISFDIEKEPLLELLKEIENIEHITGQGGCEDDKKNHKD